MPLMFVADCTLQMQAHFAFSLEQQSRINKLHCPHVLDTGFLLHN